MAGMGPDLDHVAPMAERMTQTIVEVLAQHGIDRPKTLRFNLGTLDQKWDDQVLALQAVLQEMIELDACAKF